MEANNCMGCLLPPCVLHGEHPSKNSFSSKRNIKLENSDAYSQNLRNPRLRNDLEAKNSTSSMDYNYNAAAPSSRIIESERVREVETEDELPNTSKEGNKEEVKELKTQRRDKNKCRNERESEANNNSNQIIENAISNDSQQEKDLAPTEASLNRSDNEEERKDKTKSDNENTSHSENAVTTKSVSEAGNEFETESENENQEGRESREIEKSQSETRSRSSQITQIATLNDSQQEIEPSNQFPIQNHFMAKESDFSDWFERRRRVLRRLSTDEDDEINDQQVEHTRSNTNTIIETEEDQPSSSNALQVYHTNSPQSSSDSDEILYQIAVCVVRPTVRPSNVVHSAGNNQNNLQETHPNISSQETQRQTPHVIRNPLPSAIVENLRQPSIQQSTQHAWNTLREGHILASSIQQRPEAIQGFQNQQNVHTPAPPNNHGQPILSNISQERRANSIQQRTEAIQGFQNPQNLQATAPPNNYGQPIFSNISQERRPNSYQAQSERTNPVMHIHHIEQAITVQETEELDFGNRHHQIRTTQDSDSEDEIHVQHLGRELFSEISGLSASAANHIIQSNRFVQDTQTVSNIFAEHDFNGIRRPSVHVNDNINPVGTVGYPEQMIPQPAFHNQNPPVPLPEAPRIQNNWNYISESSNSDIRMLLGYNTRLDLGFTGAYRPTTSTVVSNTDNRNSSPATDSRMVLDYGQRLNEQLSHDHNYSLRSQQSFSERYGPNQHTSTIFPGSYPINSPGSFNTESIPDRYMQVVTGGSHQHYSSNTEIVPDGYWPMAFGGPNQNNFHNAFSSASPTEINMATVTGCPYHNYSRASDNTGSIPAIYGPNISGGPQQDYSQRSSGILSLPDRDRTFAGRVENNSHNTFFERNVTTVACCPYHYHDNSRALDNTGSFPNIHDENISNGPQQNYSQRSSGLLSIPDRNRPYQLSSPASAHYHNISQHQNQPRQTSSSYSRSQAYINFFERYWERPQPTTRAITDRMTHGTMQDSSPTLSPPDIYQQQPSPATSRMNYPIPDRNYQRQTNWQEACQIM